MTPTEPVVPGAAPESLGPPEPSFRDAVPGLRLARRWMAPGGEVAVLTVVALVVRLLAWGLRPAVLADSVDLMQAAESARSAGAAAFRETSHHPLAVWLLSQLPSAPDPEVWATAAAALASCLAVGPLHVVARSAAGRHAATMACLLYAVLPKFVSVSSVPLAEPFFLPLALGALALALTCGVARSTGARLGRPLLAGTVAALAYLTRPEGLVVAAVTLVAVGVRARRGRRWHAAALVGLAFLLVAGPWVASMSQEAGHLVLTPKKDLGRFAGLADTPLGGPGGAGEASLAAGIRSVAEALWDAMGPALPLVLLGALPRRRWTRKRSRRSRWILLGGTVVLCALLLRLSTGWGYAGGRHALTAACLLLPFAGEGLTTLVGFLSRAVRRRRAALALTIALTVPLGVTAVLRPDGESGERERLLGEQIGRAERERAGGDVVVASFREPLVAYYADRELRSTGRRVRNQRLLREHAALLTVSAELEGRRADLVRALRASGASWLVLRLWPRGSGADGPKAPGDELAARLLEDGALGTPVLASSELAAFPVR